jgi:hypothetical protein
MTRAGVAFLLLAVVVEGQMPSLKTLQGQGQGRPHHVALTGQGRPLPDQFVKGHREEKPLLISNPTQHHDALTGHVSSIPDLFVKGHRDPYVIQPVVQHHDALTGQGSSIPDLFIKGHRADPPPQSFSGGFLKNPSQAGNDAFQPLWEMMNAPLIEVPLCMVSGDKCSQYVLSNQWMWLLTSVGGFKAGTCWEHGYDVNAGSEETSIPGIGKTDVRFFKKSRDAAPRVELLDQNNPEVVSTVGLIITMGVSGGILAMFYVRNALRSHYITSGDGSESLLTPGRL